MADVRSVADSIREVGGVGDMDDPQQIHDHLVNLREILDAVQEVYQKTADELPEKGTKESYAEAVGEAAASLSGVSDEMHSVIGGGVTSSSGG